MAHHDLPLSLEKKLSTRSPSGAYSVADVAERPGVSQHTLYTCVRSIKPAAGGHQAQDLLDAWTQTLRPKTQLKRTEEERDILKKEARYFERGPD